MTEEDNRHALLEAYRAHLLEETENPVTSLVRAHHLAQEKLALLNELERRLPQSTHHLAQWLLQPYPPSQTAQTHANYLTQRRTPASVFFFQILLITLTLPLALPILCLWSFFTRGSWAFWKTEGQLFVERFKESLDCFVGGAMTAQRGEGSATTARKAEKNAAVAQKNGKSNATAKRRNWGSTLAPRRMKKVAIMARRKRKVTKASNPLQDSTPPPVQPVSPPEAASANTSTFSKRTLSYHHSTDLNSPLFQLTLHTPPPHNPLSLHLFTEVLPVRPIFEAIPPSPRRVTLSPTPPKPPMAANHNTFFFTPPKPPTFSELLQAGYQNLTDEYDAHRAFQEALKKAATEAEIIQALTGLIDAAGIAYNLLEDFEGNEERRKAGLAEHITRIHAYINQLPEHYWQQSQPIQALTTQLSHISALLEKNDIQSAYADYKKLSFSPFIYYAAPHLVIWAKQFAIIFTALFPEQEGSASDINATLTHTQKILTAHYPMLATYFDQHTVQPFYELLQHYVLRNDGPEGRIKIKTNTAPPLSPSTSQRTQTHPAP